MLWNLVLRTRVNLLLIPFCTRAKTYRMVTLDHTNISKPQNIVLLVVSLLLLPVFATWVGRQERLGRPVLIPNNCWKGRPFASVCVTMFFSWAAFNAFQYQSTLLYVFYVYV